MQNNSSINPLEKLKVIVKRSHNGKTIFKDEYKVKPTEDMRMSSKNLYKLFIRYVHEEKTIKLEEFLNLFPYIQGIISIGVHNCTRIFTITYIVTLFLQKQLFAIYFIKFNFILFIDFQNKKYVNSS